ncbi:hypothetical protein [Azomonas macrocytogenes]|uniref:Chromosome segregation ATPase n=1 Tax=Azomonas macrocytogenes TaxID=69962 RepID=A0A839T653_AZOMA|nr:hypothetical protein [Azomonas macrocytogenes]MBB3103946.1 chromosome segregation ATPase [Azomonas macrocytogenes]
MSEFATFWMANWLGFFLFILILAIAGYLYKASREASTRSIKDYHAFKDTYRRDFSALGTKVKSLEEKSESYQDDQKRIERQIAELQTSIEDLAIRFAADEKGYRSLKVGVKEHVTELKTLIEVLGSEVDKSYERFNKLSDALEDVEVTIRSPDFAQVESWKLVNSALDSHGLHLQNIDKLVRDISRRVPLIMSEHEHNE